MNQLSPKDQFVDVVFDLLWQTQKVGVSIASSATERSVNSRRLNYGYDVHLGRTFLQSADLSQQSEPVAPSLKY